MSSYTRTELLTEMESAADAEGSSRWSTATKSRILDTVFAAGWEAILSEDPEYQTQVLTLTTDSLGRIPLTDLTTGSGDTLKRFHRVLDVRSAGRVFRPERRVGIPHTLATPSDVLAGSWFWFDGSYLVLGSSAATLQVALLVNYLPPLPSDLSSGGVAVTFPAPYELALAYAGAARMLMKGGTESDESRRLKMEAEELMDPLLSSIRRSSQPTQVQFSDTPRFWGGVA